MNKEKQFSKEFIDDISETISETGEPFSGFTKKYNPRALQTFFRSSYQVQMSMAAMADRKANIMVRLNSLLISGMVIFYRNIVTISEIAVVTVAIFLITLLASLIFATLAARPSITAINVDKKKPLQEVAKQMFLFTHYAAMTPNDFEQAIDIMMKDTGLVYGGMARDLRIYGQLLVEKYSLLRMSYNIFIIGLVLTVISFLIFILF